eukprot:gb/GECG01001303.1/.p1 GENE.gb/GECG01001303.1/~~gb/GECG01001303.1/.p1  ORF type:complete len:415 (+),score=22.24 gb/GECG01001303.1/:1-1245(+)
MSTSFRRHFAEYQRTEDRTPQEQHLDSQLEARHQLFHNRRRSLRKGSWSPTPVSHNHVDTYHQESSSPPSASGRGGRMAAPEQQLQHAITQHDVKVTYIHTRNRSLQGPTRLLGTDKIRRDPHIGFMVHSPLSHMSCTLLHQPKSSIEPKLMHKPHMSGNGGSVEQNSSSGGRDGCNDSNCIFSMEVERYIREHARNPHVGLRHAPPTTQYDFPGKDGVVRLGKHAVTRRATLRRQRDMAVGKKTNDRSPVLTAMSSAGLIPNRGRHHKHKSSKRHKHCPQRMGYIDEQDEYRMMTESLVTGVARTMILSSNMKSDSIEVPEDHEYADEELEWPEEPSDPIEVVDENTADSGRGYSSTCSSQPLTPIQSSSGTPHSHRSRGSGGGSPAALTLPQSSCKDDASLYGNTQSQMFHR